MKFSLPIAMRLAVPSPAQAERVVLSLDGQWAVEEGVEAGAIAYTVQFREFAASGRPRARSSKDGE